MKFTLTLMLLVGLAPLAQPAGIPCTSGRKVVNQTRAADGSRAISWRTHGVIRNTNGTCVEGVRTVEPGKSAADYSMIDVMWVEVYDNTYVYFRPYGAATSAGIWRDSNWKLNLSNNATVTVSSQPKAKGDSRDRYQFTPNKVGPTWALDK